MVILETRRKEYLSPSAREGWWRRWMMMELDILRSSAMVGVPSHESFLQDVSTCLEPQNILSQLSAHHHYSYYSQSDFMLCLLRWLGDSWNFAESMTVVRQETSSAHVGLLVTWIYAGDVSSWACLGAFMCCAGRYTWILLCRTMSNPWQLEGCLSTMPFEHLCGRIAEQKTIRGWH